MKVTIVMSMEIDDSAIENLKRIEHHAESILDLDSWPEIKSVFNVHVAEDAGEIDRYLSECKKGGTEIIARVLQQRLNEEQGILDRLVDYAKTYGEHQVPVGYIDPRDGFPLGDIVADKKVGHMQEDQFAAREEYVRTLRRVIDRF